MLSFFKKKKTVTTSVSLDRGGLIFKFELSQEYNDKDNLLEIKSDQIINCINMLNETISDLEPELEEIKEQKLEDIKNKKGRK